jgi:hypothetical protein
VFERNADDVNILDDNIVTIKRNTQTLIDASKEIGLEVNTEKTKYMSLSRHHNAGQNHDIEVGNRWFENEAQFRYLGMTVTNESLIQEEIERSLSSGNVCYHSVEISQLPALTSLLSGGHPATQILSTVDQAIAHIISQLPWQSSTELPALSYPDSRLPAISHQPVTFTGYL